MSDQPPATAVTSVGDAGQPATASSPPPALPQQGAKATAALAQDKPEVAAGAAFAAGFVVAMILKRIAR